MQERYILLTAAKNEEAYISKAIESVLRQSILPAAWFIMDDGSTDQTAAVIQSFAAKHSFIRLVSSVSSEGRDFGSQYKAIMAAYDLAESLDFGFIGVQDADIVPERGDYYESILRKFQENPRLGIAGGFIYERQKGIWQCRRSNSRSSVAGGIQMFRRECFDQIGGYMPLNNGGSDWLAQIDAKMRGWEVLACPEQHILHHRPSSSAMGKWRGAFRAGLMDASFGSHPVFEFFKCIRRIPSSPVVIGSVIRFSGYAWWKITGQEPIIGPEQAAFLRTEQVGKLRRKMWPFHENGVRVSDPPSLGVV
jgi:hypothetical protein